MMDRNRGSAFGGAILLMATVVIVILTTAMFFGDFNFDSQQTEIPEPDIVFDYGESDEGDELLIRHQEGARVNPVQLAIEVEGAGCTGVGEPDGQYQADSEFGLAEDNWLSPGMALVVNEDNPKQMCEEGDFSLDGATVTVLWENPDGEYQTVDRWEN